MDPSRMVPDMILLSPIPFLLGPLLQLDEFMVIGVDLRAWSPEPFPARRRASPSVSFALPASKPFFPGELKNLPEDEPG